METRPNPTVVRRSKAGHKRAVLAQHRALGHMKVNTFGKPDLPTLLAMKLD